VLPAAGDTGGDPNPSAPSPISSPPATAAGVSHRHNPCSSPGWQRRVFPSPSDAVPRRSRLPGRSVELHVSAFVAPGHYGGWWIPIPALFREGRGCLLGISHGAAASLPPWVADLWPRRVHYIRNSNRRHGSKTRSNAIISDLEK
jgi:hypothetical protein